ncbi:acyl carrier protein [Aneurinibacillus terranovensis]|uniref:acyl carrier protein n=1 Tax=Aneurinibacillus terranovensis TaxID=278991 RepID=UPI0004195D24|nr:acyl carrier protein [Aneurinibacillus terranovensis]
MIEKQIEKVICDFFGIEDVNDNLKMGDIENWDSLGHIALISEIERSLNIVFNTDEILSMKSVKEIKNKVKQLVG